MALTKWGILGCGGIAEMFMSSIQAVDGAQVVACAATNQQRAVQFAEKHAIKDAYGDYETLISDAQEDAIYVANTHNAHYQTVLKCLERRIPVLCEKPLTVNKVQTDKLFAVAGANKTLLVEAVWMRFLPAIRRLQDVVSSGTIGEIQAIDANFSISGDFDSEHRLNNPNTAGGALLDLGIYPISFADLFFDQQPVTRRSVVTKSTTGVDETNSILLQYANGAIATLSSSFVRNAPIRAMITGSKGYIEIPHFLGAKTFTIHTQHGSELIEEPYAEGQNFKFEIEEFQRCLELNATESSIIPAARTQRIMGIMDALREEWGICYPDDVEGL